jgi:hypothetical protein
MAEEELNTGLNLNRARQDKFQLLLSNIPSSAILPQEEINDVMQSAKLSLNDMEFFRLSLQGVSLPEWSIGEQRIATQFGVPISHTTNVHEFSPLTTTLRMDENYTLYKMLWLWIMLMNDPEKANQLTSKQQSHTTQVTSYLYVKDNYNKSVLGFQFFDLRPMTLPSIDLNYTSEGTEIDFSVTWMYSYFMPVKPNAQPYDILLTDEQIKDE